MGFLKSITKPFKSVTKSVGKVLGSAGSLIGAGIGGYFGGPTGAAVGSSIGGMFQAQQGAEEQNEANSAQAQRQMDFQERMSNTSWQRGMADMRNAGLNPIFAYKSGGASTPNGAMAVMQNEGAAGVDGFSRMANSAIALSKQKSELKALKETAKNLNYEGARIMSAEGLNTQQSAMIRTQMASAKQQADQEAIRTEILKSTAPVIKYKNKDMLNNKFRYGLGQWLGSIGNLLGGGNSALSYQKMLTGGK